jgi:hypothetical protein
MATRKDLPPSCVSDLRFDRWHAEELEPEESRAVEAHLRDCARCQQRNQELRVQAEAFLRAYPLPARIDLGGRVVAPSGGKPPHLSRWAVAWLSGTLAFATAVVWLVVLPKRDGTFSKQVAVQFPTAESSDEKSSATRLKGSARLGFFVKREGRVIRGHDGFTVHPGDRLRFSVTTLEPQHVAILSRDGKGVVSECFPGDGRSRKLAVSHDDLLDSSVELDDTLGNETIVAVFCDEPFEVAPLVAKLGRDGTLEIGANCSLDSLEIRKTAR